MTKDRKVRSSKADSIIEDDALKTMDKTEYRTIMKYYYLKGKSAQKIYTKLHNVFGTSSPSYENVLYWITKFKKGRMSVADESRSGRPLGKQEVKERLCPICGKTLASGASLTLHMRVHTGERPFKCGSCDKTFSRSDKKRHHELAFHSESHMRNFGCDYCGKRFVSGAILRIHLRIHVRFCCCSMDSMIDNNYISI